MISMPNITLRFAILTLAFSLMVAGLLGAVSPAEARPARNQSKLKPKPEPKPEVEKIDYSTRDEVREFVREMAENHQFEPDELLQMFARVRHDSSVIKYMQPAPVGFKRSWSVYRERFLDPLRQREGARFWKENEANIRKASDLYGVPEEIIVAIIGVETIYGRITGDYRVIDSLTVLGFDYPRRAAFFKSELEQFLLFTRENSLDVFSVRGSFAGAIGLPQFMPGSIRRFAVDFDGDGRIDLRGWQRGQATHFQLTFADEQRLSPMIQAGIEPKFVKTELDDYGVQVEPALPDDMKVALIDLPNGDNTTSYYLGAQNFFVITRYNRSSFYAMAVIELSRALRASRLTSANLDKP
jgi:membrane-bound lytic murein transglycosylase B